MTSVVPFVDLRANCEAVGEEVLDAIQRVVKGAAFVLGEEVRSFETEFAAYCGVAHGVGVDSGTSALELALRAFGVGPGDEVITAANTFVATAFAIHYTGARPVLVDVDPATYTLSAEAVERALSRQTRAIVPVHLYGQTADMAPILDLARRHGLVVVEDACQAHGATYQGRRAGSLGDAGAFSFYPSKNLGAFGDAGLVVTGDGKVAERLRRLRDYGQVEKYRHASLGYNRRLDELQAAVLRVKLRRLDEWNRARRRAAVWYGEALRGLDVGLPAEAGHGTHVYHLYVVRVAERDALRSHLQQAGVHTGIHYPIPIHRQEAFADLGHGPGAFRLTERLSGEILSLPMFPELSREQVERVASLIRGFLGGSR